MTGKRNQPLDPGQVFVLMPFDSGFLDVYEKLIRDTLEEMGFSVDRADDIHASGNIVRRVVRKIQAAQLIVADLSQSNANVYYELGIAHSLDKPTILLTQDELDTLPFDLRNDRVIRYSTRFGVADDLCDVLKSTAQVFLTGSEEFDNPIITALEKPGIDDERNTHNPLSHNDEATSQAKAGASNQDRPLGLLETLEQFTQGLILIDDALIDIRDRDAQTMKIITMIENNQSSSMPNLLDLKADFAEMSSALMDFTTFLQPKLAGLNIYTQMTRKAAEASLSVIPLHAETAGGQTPAERLQLLRERREEIVKYRTVVDEECAALAKATSMNIAAELTIATEAVKKAMRQLIDQLDAIVAMYDRAIDIISRRIRQT